MDRASDSSIGIAIKSPSFTMRCFLSRCSFKLANNMLFRALSLEIGVTTLRKVISDATGGACGLAEVGLPDAVRLSAGRRLNGRGETLTCVGEFKFARRIGDK